MMASVLEMALFIQVSSAFVMIVFTIMLLIAAKRAYIKWWLCFWIALFLSQSALLLNIRFDVTVALFFYVFFMLLAMPFLLHGVLVARVLNRSLSLIRTLYIIALGVFVVMMMPFNPDLKVLMLYVYTGTYLILSGTVSLVSSRLLLRVFGYTAITTGVLNVYFPFLDDTNFTLFLALLTLSAFGMSLSMLLFPVASMVIEQKHQNRQLEHQSMHDDLTGAKSRAYLTRQAHALEASDDAFGLLVIDVNNLKAINDEYGHLVGDEIIKQTAQMLLNIFANQDVCRFGGDEFVIMFSPVLPKATMDALLSKVHASITDVELSIGYAIRREQETYHDVFIRAETRMYQDKHQ